MTTTTLAPYLTQQFFNNTGAFNAGGTLTSYQAGTVIPIATYTDVTGLTVNTNPIVLNARGEVGPGGLWLLPNTAYKFVLQDSSGNTIWTRDNVTNAQLLTLFGGVDTGSANNYLLNFAWPYTSYGNGEVIYWIPANSNTGPSTLNVNGLGVVPITNINGSALGANQIVAGQTTEVMYYNGAFQLISIGSFNGVTIGTFGQEVPIASAATTDLGTAPAHVVLITGTTTITSFGTSASVQAPIYIIRFQGTLTLTFNAVSMILPGNANIITTPGDAALLEYLGSGNWKILGYFSSTGAGGLTNSKIKPADTTQISNTTLTPDPDLLSNPLAVGRYSYELMLLFDSVAAGAGFKFVNDGTAIDSRALSPVVETGFVNAAAVTRQSTFYAAPIVYASVSTGANSNQSIYKGSLLVSTPGTFGVSWAQNTSTASNTTLRAGSYLTLSLLNTGSSSNIVQHVYSTPGSFTETIPTGFTTLTLEVWGGSGGGGARFTSGIDGAGGGGGASGSYCLSSISVLGLGGDTLNFTVGAAGVVATTGGGASTVTSGTLVIATMTAPGGGLGGAATGLFAPGAGGSPGGVATGGTATNTNGNTGAAGSPSSGIGSGSGGQGGVGGFGISGINGGGTQGGHGAGLLFFTGGSNGGAGLIVFNYH